MAATVNVEPLYESAEIASPMTEKNKIFDELESSPSDDDVAKSVTINERSYLKRSFVNELKSPLNDETLCMSFHAKIMKLKDNSSLKKSEPKVKTYYQSDNSIHMPSSVIENNSPIRYEKVPLSPADLNIVPSSRSMSFSADNSFHLESSFTENHSPVRLEKLSVGPSDFNILQLPRSMTSSNNSESSQSNVTENNSSDLEKSPLCPTDLNILPLSRNIPSCGDSSIHPESSIAEKNMPTSPINFNIMQFPRSVPSSVDILDNSQYVKKVRLKYPIIKVRSFDTGIFGFYSQNYRNTYLGEIVQELEGNKEETKYNSKSDDHIFCINLETGENMNLHAKSLSIIDINCYKKCMYLTNENPSVNYGFQCPDNVWSIRKFFIFQLLIVGQIE